MYLRLKPECCGSFGRRTLYGGELSAVPPEVYRLEYEFSTWPVDPLLEVSGLFIATEELTGLIQRLQPKPTGVSYDKATTATTIECRRANPDANLPEYSWLKITGRAGHDDFGYDSEHALVVSERVYVAMRLLLSQCGVSAYISEQQASST